MRHIIICISALLAGCASTPDPDVVCTSSWVEPRAERAIERIEKRLDDTFVALKSAGESWIEGTSPGPIQMYRLSRATKKLEKELTDGPGIRDLRTLAATCDDPVLIRDQIDNLLKRQQISDRIMGFLDVTGILDRIVEMAEGPAANG